MFVVVPVVELREGEGRLGLHSHIEDSCSRAHLELSLWCCRLGGVGVGDSGSGCRCGEGEGEGEGEREGFDVPVHGSWVDKGGIASLSVRS